MTEPTTLAESRQRRIESAIRARVRIALDHEHHDEFCERADFAVDVEAERRVTLRGQVCDAESIRKAERIARSQVGVSDVQTQLQVLAPSAGARPDETRSDGPSTRAARDVVDALSTIGPEASDDELSSALAESLAVFIGPTAETEEPWFSDPVVRTDDWQVDIDVDDERLRVSGSVPDDGTLDAIQGWASLVARSSRRIEAVDSRDLRSAPDAG